MLCDVCITYCSWLTTFDLNSVVVSEGNCSRISLNTCDERLIRCLAWFADVVPSVLCGIAVALTEHLEIIHEEINTPSHFSSQLNVGSTVPSSHTRDHILVVGAHMHAQRESYFSSFVSELFRLPSKFLEASRMIIASSNEAVTLLPDNADSELENGKEGDRGPLVSVELESLLNRYSDLTSDSVQNCMRELRVFYREALANLFKNRKYGIFARSVDPELVPDYYDIIKSPMDLETMR